MKHMRVFGFLLCLLFGWGSSAFAQLTKIGKLTPSNNSVTKVMESAGCNTGWIFQVLQDSDIQVTQLRHLPEGQEVVLFANSCLTEPPPVVAHMSAIILRMDAVTGQVQKTEKENVVLRRSVSTLGHSLESARRENGQLSIEKKTLEGKLLEVEQAKPSVIAPGRFGLKAVTIVGVAGFAVGLLIMWFVMDARYPKGSFFYPPMMKIKEGGKEYVFTFAGASEATAGSGNFIGKYKCPLCSERNIFGRDENLRRHLSSAHPAERVESVVDPSLSQESRPDTNHEFDLELDLEHAGEKH
jgi:hypothetical protein